MTAAASTVEHVVAELRAGNPVVLPTDTVYGLCSDPGEEPVRRLYAVKGRPPTQPTAIIAGSVEAVVERLPGLAESLLAVLRALLPGPYTLVLPNPARLYPWLGGASAETLGVRVPAAPPPLAAVLTDVGAVAATSANLPGGPDPRRLEDVPAEIRSACLAIDGGELAGRPSTVVDLTGDEPRILREGAVAAAEALARIRGSLR